MGNIGKEGLPFSGRADLHIHTIHSKKDSILTPRALVQRAQIVGLDCVAVTNHNTADGAEEVREEARVLGSKLVVIKGEEVKTEEGIELIAYPLKETIPEGLSVRQTLLEIKKQGAFVTVPHPFEIWRHGAGEASEEIIAYAKELEIPLLWETFNSRSSRENNKESADFYYRMNGLKRAGLLKVAGSDAHHPREIGRVGLDLPYWQTKEELLKSLRLSSRFAVNFRGDDDPGYTLLCRILAKAPRFIGVRTSEFIEKLIPVQNRLVFLPASSASSTASSAGRSST